MLTSQASPSSLSLYFVFFCLQEQNIFNFSMLCLEHSVESSTLVYYAVRLEISSNTLQVSSNLHADDLHGWLFVVGEEK